MLAISRAQTIVPQILIMSSFAYLSGKLESFGGPGQIGHIDANTIYGKVRGSKEVSRDGRVFFQFTGIPYAKPPVGHLRFEPPVEIEPWGKLHKNAFIFGVQIEITTRLPIGSEGFISQKNLDCLYLNVYTHKVDDLRRSSKNPVLVYFYGGAFMTGFSNIYNPKYFMDEDIVLVTCNYRLASFGFLNTMDGQIRGNMGLKDQVLVLKWIQNNIEYFGGDKNMVTISGSSAGAASVHMHTLSPRSKGLFHKMISHSGSAIGYWSIGNDPLKQSTQFAKKLKCPTRSRREMVKCLKRLDYKTIVNEHYSYIDPLLGRIEVYGPTIEIVKDETSFLTESPRYLLENGLIETQVPIYDGVNSDEGMLVIIDIYRNKSRENKLNSNWNRYAPNLFGYEDHPNSTEISRKIWNFYLKDKKVGRESMREVIDMFSDRIFYEGIHDLGRILSNYSQPIYFFYYSYVGTYSLANLALRMSLKFPQVVSLLASSFYSWFSTFILGSDKQPFVGACHTDELAMFWALPISREIYPGTVDYAFSKEIISSWASFVRDGKPKPFFGVEWNSIQENQNISSTEVRPRYMEFNLNPKMIYEPFTERIKFWKSLNV